MKKILKSLLAVFLLLVFVNSASAVEMTVSQIEETYAKKGYYIIGSFLFTRAVGEEQYTGTLTAQYIMRAAQSVTDSDLSSMKAYYKTSKNEYVDAVTLEPVSFPSTFQIDYVNMKRISPYYGDLNESGNIDMTDVKILESHLKGETLLTGTHLENADVNDDSEVNYVDLALLKGFASGYYPNTLPSKKITNYLLLGDVWGNDGKIVDRDLIELAKYLEDSSSTTINVQAADVNQDGKVDEKDEVILSYYIAEAEIGTKLPYEKAIETAYIITMYDGSDVIDKVGTLTGYRALKKAEKEGYVFEGWYTDSALKNKVNVNDSLTSDVNVYAKFIPKAFGDVNCDGQINQDDETLLDKYLEESTTLTTKGIENADVNGDGKITQADLTLLKGFIKGYYQNTLPLYQIKDAKIIGDVFADGKVDITDAVMIAQLKGTEKLGTDMSIADLNQDGKIDKKDEMILSRYLANWSSVADLPYKYCTEEKIWEVQIYNNDEPLETQYIDDNEEIKGIHEIVAGYKLEGIYQDKDFNTLWNSSNKITSDLKLYAKYVELSSSSYGDINGDNAVDITDVVALVQHLSGKNRLTTEQATRADVNCNGEVETEDLIILKRHLASWSDYETLPYKNKVVVDNDNLF